MIRVLVADNISNDGIDILRRSTEVDVKLKLKPAELISIIGDYDALLVRSQTKVTTEVISAGTKLQIIGRAGVGVDNIDIEEATRRGIVVVNAPSGNTISAAEHSIALMFALARNIPQANASLKAGEWRRREFTGNEVRNKTLGIIGLGSVGAEVAKRARGLEMKLIAYDPLISIDRASKLQVELMPLEQLLREADFITLHVPLIESTRGLIGDKELKLVKPTVRIINCARGGLIDESALIKAIKEKRVGGAAIDVFPKEPITESALFDSDNIIVTPHLGASTTEAQTLVATDVATQIVDFFKGQPVKHPVNAPLISTETLAILKPFLNAASVIGRLASQLTEGQMSSIQIKYEGELANYDTNSLKAAALEGILGEISDERINVVNANLVTARRGISVVEQKEATCKNYSSLITIELTTSTGVTTVAGTVMRDELHIVRVNSYWFDMVPTGGYFLFSDHRDCPGLISAVSKVTGDADVNISSMHVGRLKPRGQALMILVLDEPLLEEQLKQILAIPDVYSAKLVKL
ncbi:MAG: phosphoglycerate dehydrogenase [Dehalococcoidales bacterium]|nr:phosphoglycerate dehydrogenase [Dehalococcoidales bacterium]